MPLTPFQKALAKLMALNRTPDSHLAGGAALHFSPNSVRYSNDLDYFHDSVERVVSAFDDDKTLLVENGYEVKEHLNRPGFIRALVSKNGESTKVEWVHDSSWRFMPTQYVEGAGYCLHPIDLATNKVLALAGRDEPRDFLDVLHCHQTILSLGALCWAAVGKDPGFTPMSLLALLRRRGKYHHQDFERLKLSEPVDLPSIKNLWLDAVEQAQEFIAICPPKELGCLYYSVESQHFITPDAEQLTLRDVVMPHFGRPGGVLPTYRE